MNAAKKGVRQVTGSSNIPASSLRLKQPATPASAGASCGCAMDFIFVLDIKKCIKCRMLAPGKFPAGRANINNEGLSPRGV